jgi:filamentous hemagglutinin family protein
MSLSTRVGWLLGIGMSSISTFSSSTAVAQITPDGTLGTESSVVTPNVDINGTPSDRIDGGATRGSNLFHSFEQFNVEENRGAYFSNPSGIENIITRVTGSSASNINGTLGVLGSANLFFINPNGIIFGSNARLEVGGSFVGSTASGIQFGEQGFFSASNPTSNTPLLTVNPSALFFNQTVTPIQNNSVAPAGTESQGFDVFGLRVPDGKSLLLIGGNINMNGGELNAYGGRIELGGLANTGSVALNVNGDNISAGFPTSTARADVSLTNSARIYVEAGGGGSITVNARNLDIRNESVLSAGIGRGLGTEGAVAGDIALNATGEINIVNSTIFNLVRTQGRGNAGDVNITATTLGFSDGAQLAASTFGQGDAGNVIIDAGGSVSFNNRSVAFSRVEQGGVGKGGKIQISADSLSLTNGAQLASATLGQGDAGNVIINIRKNVFFDTGGVFSIVASGGVGKGGNVQISADSLSLTNGAQLQALTNGQGGAGNVIINAREHVSFDGTNTTAFSTVQPSGVGKGGDVQISADSLSLTNGAQLASATLGQGDAGNVRIDAGGSVSFDGTNTTAFSTVQPSGVGKGGNVQISTDSLSLTNGAALTASTLGQGDAGNVRIDARGSVSFDDSNGLSRVSEGGVGKGGNVQISTETLSLTNGAALIASTDGQGDAGNVIIEARGSVSFDGTSSDGRFFSAAFSDVRSGGVGKGGNVQISADSLSLTNGAQLASATLGQGDAGNVIIDVRGSVSFDGTSSDGRFVSGALSTVEKSGVGIGGNVQISADSLSVTNGAELQTLTRGQGDAGNIEINAKNIVTVFGTSSSEGFSGGLFTSALSNSTGKSGNITVNTPNLRISDGGVLDARTENNRNGGNITLNVRLVEILNSGQVLSTSSSAGDAGKITVNATDGVIIDGSDSTYDERLRNFGSDRVNIIDASSGLFVRAQSTGSAGNIEITAPSILLDNTGTISADTTGGGGNIQLTTPLLLLRRGSSITTNARGSEIPGGNITLDATDGFIIAFDGENSDISANSEEFRGGNVQINAQGVFGISARQLASDETNDITATGANSELAGTIVFNVPDIEPTQGQVQPPELVNTDNLIANSCIARTNRQVEGTFFITGSGGLPYRPGERGISQYSTGRPRRVSNTLAELNSTSRPWRKGDPIVEPSGVFRLPSGRVVLSRECSQS